MQTRIIAKKEVNFNDHETMKFNEIYELMITLFQTEKCCQKLEKFKSADAVRKLMCQHETLLKTDSIVMRADRILSNVQKAESDYQKRKKKNKTLKKIIKNTIN